MQQRIRRTFRDHWRPNIIIGLLKPQPSNILALLEQLDRPFRPRSLRHLQNPNQRSQPSRAPADHAHPFALARGPTRAGTVALAGGMDGEEAGVVGWLEGLTP